MKDGCRMTSLPDVTSSALTLVIKSTQLINALLPKCWRNLFYPKILSIST